MRIFAEVTGTFAWTLGVVTAGGWFDWLSQLPLELEITLPDGTNCLCVHSHPGIDDGPGIDRELSDDKIRALLQKCTADLICVGHTHQQINRRVGNWHVFNPGSISNPRPPILEASYALLEATTEDYKIEHRTVDYNREEIILQVQKLRHPGAEFIIKHMRGEHK
jgi:hypothetical protein